MVVGGISQLLTRSARESAHHADDDTDEPLLTAARRGDDAAFTLLYRQHVAAARREARRRCGRSLAPDDAVAAAFASVFRAILNGGGPADRFKPYLIAAVRNAVIDQSRRTTLECTSIGEVEVADAPLTSPDCVDLGSSMGAAFLTLPERQREALWQTEVEGRHSSEMARALRLSDNAFAALKKRARQNLAGAYARQITGGDVCSWVEEQAGALAAGTLGYAHRLVVDMHVEDCVVCAAVVPQRDRRTAPLLGLPLLLAAPAVRRTRGATALAGANVAGRALLVTGTRAAAVLTTAVGLSATGIVLITNGSGRPSIARADPVATIVAQREDALLPLAPDAAIGETGAPQEQSAPTTMASEPTTTSPPATTSTSSPASPASTQPQPGAQSGPAPSAGAGDVTPAAPVVTGAPVGGNVTATTQAPLPDAGDGAQVDATTIPPADVDALDVPPGTVSPVPGTLLIAPPTTTPPPLVIATVPTTTAPAPIVFGTILAPPTTTTPPFAIVVPTTKP